MHHVIALITSVSRHCPDNKCASCHCPNNKCHAIVLITSVHHVIALITSVHHVIAVITSVHHVIALITSVHHVIALITSVHHVIALITSVHHIIALITSVHHVIALITSMSRHCPDHKCASCPCPDNKWASCCHCSDKKGASHHCSDDILQGVHRLIIQIITNFTWFLITEDLFTSQLWQLSYCNICKFVFIHTLYFYFLFSNNHDLPVRSWFMFYCKESWTELHKGFFFSSWDVFVIHCSESINSELDRKRQKLSDHGERLQQLQSKQNELGSRKLAIDADLQQGAQLQENKQQLTEKLQALEAEIEVGHGEMVQGSQGNDWGHQEMTRIKKKMSAMLCWKQIFEARTNLKKQTLKSTWIWLPSWKVFDFSFCLENETCKLAQGNPFHETSSKIQTFIQENAFEIVCQRLSIYSGLSVLTLWVQQYSVTTNLQVRCSSPLFMFVPLFIRLFIHSLFVLCHFNYSWPKRSLKANLLFGCVFYLIIWLCWLIVAWCHGSWSAFHPSIHPTISILYLCPILWGWQHQAMSNPGSPCISVYGINAS